MASRTPGAFNAPGSMPGGVDAICSVPYSAWDLEATRNGASVSRVSTSLWRIKLSLCCNIWWSWFYGAISVTCVGRTVLTLSSCQALKAGTAWLW
jgi:hypothetical protein